MFSIIIDFLKIVKHSNLTLLERKIKPFPTNFKHTIGLILTIPSEIHQELLDQPLGKSRINFINSPHFVNSIIDHVFMQYEARSKICEIEFRNPETISSILDSILYYIPNNFKILTYTQLNNNQIIDQLILKSFKNPYISNESQLGQEFNSDMLFLSKTNKIEDIYNARNDIDFTIERYKRKNSTPLQFTFDKITTKKLKKLSRFGSSLNGDGTISQKEIAGCFNIKRIDKLDDDYVHILEICDNSFILGSEEQVNNVRCRFSFHTHPFTLYDVYRFKLGYPSNADYLGFLLSIETGNLFHIVISNEGIYIISLSKEWNKEKVKNSKEELREFILKKFKFRKTNSDITLESYIKKVNEIKFKNKKIFNLEFRNWNNITIPFSILEQDSKPKTSLKL